MKQLDIEQLKDLIIFCKKWSVASLNYENVSLEMADMNLIEDVEDVSEDKAPEQPDFGFSRNLRPLPQNEDDEE